MTKTRKYTLRNTPRFTSTQPTLLSFFLLVKDFCALGASLSFHIEMFGKIVEYIRRAYTQTFILYTLSSFHAVALFKLDDEQGNDHTYTHNHFHRYYYYMCLVVFNFFSFESCTNKGFLYGPDHTVQFKYFTLHFQ